MSTPTYLWVYLVEHGDLNQQEKEKIVSQSHFEHRCKNSMENISKLNSPVDFKKKDMS